MSSESEDRISSSSSTIEEINQPSIPPLRSAATSDSGFDGAVDNTNEQSNSLTSFNPTIVDDLHSTAIGTPPLLDTPLTHTSTQNAYFNSVTRQSLSAGTEGLVLYDLTSAAPYNKEFSPHCVKTLMDLKLLDIGYDRQRLTFTQIRTELAKRIGDNAATVPTLELSDGTHLQDSWLIANWLANHHPKGHALFPFQSSKPFAASLNAWGRSNFAPQVRPLTRPPIHDILTGESKIYFEQVKVGKQKLEKMRSITQSEREEQIQKCIIALEPIQDALSAVRESHNSSAQSLSTVPLWLEGSQEPTHADFCVYGWYVHSRSTGPSITREIWHALPLVSQWINALNAWAGNEITKDFF